MKVPVPDFNDHIHKWQLEVLEKFDEGKYRFFLLNWHRRARKTTLAINLLIREACTHPKSVYLYVAPTYKQAKSIIWTDPNMLFKYLPKELVKRKNETDLLIELVNGSYIQIKGGDDADSLRGIDCVGVVIDEWSLFKDRMIWEEILRPVLSLPSRYGKRWAFFTFTPKGRNHAYDYWQSAKGEKWGDWYTSLLTTDTSKIMTPAELMAARDEMHPSMFRQEFMCEFTADDENVLIPFDFVDRLKRVIFLNPDERKILAIDPSEGGDECVLYAIKGGEIIDQKFLYGEKFEMQIAGEAMRMCNTHGIVDIAIDAIGVGAGIASRLTEMTSNDPHFTVRRIISGARAMDSDQFANLRAEMWWTVFQLIAHQKVKYPGDEELIRQLTAPIYEMTSTGKVKMELKSKTKERLKRSPDRADAYIYGMYALQFVRTAEDRMMENRYTSEYNKERVYAGGRGGW